MPNCRLGIFLLFLLTAAMALAQEDWQPVIPQDLQIKDVPGDPGAPAIQLYYAHYIDDKFHSQFFYKRIKILNDKGNKYADVEVPLLIPDCSFTDLKARTIHPDGKIIEFQGKPFEKTILKGQGFKYLAKTFTMPEVTPGSIIEYKYLIIMPEHTIYNNAWAIQHDLYTVKESFRIKAFLGALETKHGGDTQLDVVYNHLPANLKPERKPEGFELKAQNIPAFQPEASMPPEINYEPEVLFFYGGREYSSPDQFWQQAGRDWNSGAEHFIGNHSEIQAAATAAVGKETDWEPQVRKLYARAQQIRNLSYERLRTAEELAKEGIKPNSNVVDVLNHGYGTRRDIALFFVALARAGGFRASVVRAGNRFERFFNKGLLEDDQLDTDIAVVKINGQDVYLDPGTRFCPYGLVRWTRTSTTALKLDKDGGTFVTVSNSTYDQAILHRDATLTLGEDGTAAGDLTVQFQGLWALEQRLAALETDEAGRKHELEEEIKHWLPSGAEVSLTKSDGWEGEDEPLIAIFHLKIPGYATVAGKRLVVPQVIFPRKQREAFKAPERKYPVYFNYAFSERDTVQITVPEGYSVEGAPKNQDVRLPYAAYQSMSQMDSGKLITHRNLLVNGFYFNVAQYPEVRDFFNKVLDGDEQQAVLRLGATTNAQKAN